MWKWVPAVVILGVMAVARPDTASTLDPGDPSDPEFPQRGHGSIALTVLFNDPEDVG